MDISKKPAANSEDLDPPGTFAVSESQQPFAMAFLAVCLALMAWFVIDQRIRQGKLIDIDDVPKIAWDMKVDVNRADGPELTTLPGVGPVLANAIVEHRVQHGPYRSPQDLLGVPGIGETKLKQISGFLLFVVDSEVSDLTTPVD